MPVAEDNDHLYQEIMKPSTEEWEDLPDGEEMRIRWASESDARQQARQQARRRGTYQSNRDGFCSVPLNMFKDLVSWLLMIVDDRPFSVRNLYRRPWPRTPRKFRRVKTREREL